MKPSFLVSALAVVITAAAPGSSPAQYQIKHGVNAAGGRSSNAIHRVYDVVGQPVTGTMTGPVYHHAAGYVPAAKHYLLSSYTAVAITAFTVEARRDRVVLRWVAAPGSVPTGYNVYRSENRAGDFVNIAGGLIPAGNGSTYEDAGVRPGAEYFYRVGAVDGDGEFFSQTLSVITPVWRTDLFQNRPNPFNPSTSISFYLAAAADVTLTIFDVRGKHVRTLLDGPRGYGEHDVRWDGRNDRGETVGSGVYFYRLRAGKEIYTRKMTLLK